MLSFRMLLFKILGAENIKSSWSAVGSRLGDDWDSVKNHMEKESFCYQIHFVLLKQENCLSNHHDLVK